MGKLNDIIFEIKIKFAIGVIGLVYKLYGKCRFWKTCKYRENNFVCTRELEARHACGEHKYRRKK